MHILISNCAGFINTFANSVGLKKLGWKYYFVFVAWDFVYVQHLLVIDLELTPLQRFRPLVLLLRGDSRVRHCYLIHITAADRTCRRTLEELNEVFDSPYPARYSAKKLKVAVKADGDIKVVGEA